MDETVRVNRRLSDERRNTLRMVEMLLMDMVNRSEREVEVMEVEDMLNTVMSRVRTRDVEVQQLGND